MSRATSLIGKLPGRFKLIESILGSNTRAVTVQEDEDRGAILRLASSEGTAPYLREFMFRGLDGSLPSQVCIRYGEEKSSGSQLGTLAIAASSCTCTAD